MFFNSGGWGCENPQLRYSAIAEYLLRYPRHKWGCLIDEDFIFVTPNPLEREGLPVFPYRTPTIREDTEYNMEYDMEYSVNLSTDEILQEFHQWMGLE